MAAVRVGTGDVDSVRFAANLSWLFTELPFEQRFDAAAAAGFSGVEYASPYDYPPDVLRRWLDAAGLSQVLINSPVGPTGAPGAFGIACDPGATDAFRAGLRSAVEYATALGGPLVHVLGGIRPAGATAEAVRSTYRDNLAWALELVEPTALTLVVEGVNQHDVPGFVLESTDDAASVVRAADHRQLRLLFDVYHCQMTHGEVLGRLRELFPLIGHIQIADVPHRHEPGTGTIEWPAVFDEIRALGYEGWVSCEYRPKAKTGTGLTWRRTLTGPARPQEERR